MSLTKKEQETMINTLKGKEFEQAFHIVTERNWWADDTMTNDTERAKFLYETYFDYYNLLFTEGVKGIEIEEAYILNHQLKLQLDKELIKIKKGIYENEEEGEQVERYKVIKDIVKGEKVVAKAGDYLTVQKNPNRLYGISTLKKGAVTICDVGSRLEKEHCIKAYN